MSILPSDLENPETSLDLETRPAQSRRRARPGALVATAPAPEAELAALRARIDAARTLAPPKPTHRVHNCRTCFNNGRDATIRAIEEP